MSSWNFLLSRKERTNVILDHYNYRYVHKILPAVTIFSHTNTRFREPCRLGVYVLNFLLRETVSCLVSLSRQALIFTYLQVFVTWKYFFLLNLNIYVYVYVFSYIYQAGEKSLSTLIFIHVYKCIGLMIKNTNAIVFVWNNFSEITFCLQKRKRAKIDKLIREIFGKVCDKWQMASV